MSQLTPSNRITHLADLYHRAEMSNGTSVPSNWALTSTGSNFGITWSPQSGGTGSVSFGSNSNEVSYLNAPGASSLASRADHVHQGVHKITAAGSNGLFGDIDFATGAGMAITTSGQTMRWTNTFAVHVIPFVINGAGSVIGTGVAGDIEIPFSCTIVAVTMLADQTGSIVVDIWKETYGSYPPTVGDSITASAKPTISSAIKSQDTGLAGWTKNISAGDTLRYNVDSATTITRVLVSLKVLRS